MPHYLSHTHEVAYYKNQKYNDTILSDNKGLVLHVRGTGTRLHHPVVETKPSYSFRSAYWKSRDETQTLLAENDRLKKLAALKTPRY